MQTNQHPQNNTNNNPNVVVQNGGTNMLPITNFNPSLPTEPLPYEETLNMQKSDMEVSSPHGKVLILRRSREPSFRDFPQLDYLILFIQPLYRKHLMRRKVPQTVQEETLHT